MLQLIKVLLNNTIYNKYNTYIIDLIKDNKELYLILKHLDNLHSKYNRDISVPELTLSVLSSCLDKDRDNLAAILAELSATDTDSIVLDDVIQDVLKRKKAYDVAITALEVSEGRKDFGDLLTLANDLNATTELVDTSTEVFVTNDLEELYNGSVQKQGLRWRLGTLNRMLGSLRKGDFGFIFARPETGKTTFLASEITHFATQTENLVLWFNNEEQGEKVQLRLYQAMLGVTLEQLYSDIPGNRQKYLDLGGSNIKIIDSAAIHKRTVEDLVKKYNPALVIFDQIDKIKGFDDDREDLRLGQIYIWAREIAKQYCPVIGVCQADASGEGKRWLTMENVANAKTAKQAEADWILGIGKTHIDAEEYTRHLHLCKNKLTGDADTEPDLRHGKASVLIRPEIARYGDIQ